MNDAEVVGARLSKLRAQWTAFTQRDAARLLLWQAEDDEVALIAGFLEVESNAEVAETPDLFLQLTSPFSDEATHGFTLVSELIAQHAEVTADTGEEEGPAWSPDQSLGDEDDVGTLLRVLASFYGHYGHAEANGRLGVWLDADEVGDRAAYGRWLRRVIACAPDAIRCVVVVAASEGPPEALLSSDRERVEVARCALDVPGALEMLLTRGAEPSGLARYRLLMVRLLNGRAALDDVGEWAAEATRIAVDSGEFALAALAQMLLAGALSEHQRTDQGLARFTEADRFAAQQEQAENARDGTASKASHGAKIRLMAKLGGAALRLSMRDHDGARWAYLEAASLARANGELGVELDCHRLASVCLALDGCARLAWEVGMRGLRTGLETVVEARPVPALVQLASHLSRLTTEYRSLHPYQQPLAAQLEGVLGADWADRLSESRAA